MYRHCIYCSAELGANESFEAFPVGRTVAFDGAKGRLWAICPKCSRWNLAPIEERWEPVEEAEKAFAGSRLRVQRENIGVAKLRDGTRLVRVGEALTGELAAWRYGEQFTRRRLRARWLGAATLTAYAAVMGFGLAGLIPGGLAWGLSFVEEQVRRNRVVHRLSPNGRRVAPVVLRRKHLDGARLAPGDGDELRLLLPGAPVGGPKDPTALEGPEANRLLQRIMVVRNSRGATRLSLAAALDQLADAGSAEALIGQAARDRMELFAGPPPPMHSFKIYRSEPTADLRSLIAGPGALALEMALHEESERRALEGELVLLQSAWREAEEIAAIADGLAGESALKEVPSA
ncbi:MAG: hypothetical protein ACJ8GN_07160 [Longimicrobiaceae bacterium]